jgi:phosphoserine phosphatase RsbU/P
MSNDPQGTELGELPWFRKFNTRFLLVTGLSVLVGAVFNMLISNAGMQRLSAESSREIEAGLNTANREYLTNHIDDTAAQATSRLHHAYDDLTLFANIVQQTIDHDEELIQFRDSTAAIPFFKDDLIYNDKGKWSQNTPGEPTSVSVWGYMLENGVPRADVQRAINNTAVLDLIMPTFKKYGADKLRIYYVGDKTAPYTRMAPYTDLGSDADKQMPGHNEKNWYDFFFPKLVEGWEAWPQEAKRREGREQITITAPYDDAAGGGLVMTVFYPLWNKDRTTFAGTVALDLTLGQIIKFVESMRLHQTGFAFLAQSDGNVLAINDAGAKTLGLQRSAAGGGTGVDIVTRRLGDSKEPAITILTLPADQRVLYQDIDIGGELHVIVMKRLDPVKVWLGDRIATEHWTLGFVVRKSELYQSLYAAQRTINSSRGTIQMSQALIGVGSILVLMAGVYLVARRMTDALVALSDGASHMRQRNYDVRVEATTGDEIGQLTDAFNDMAAEIRVHTNNLEELVRARTGELEEARAMLAEENLRLGAELGVAKDLQRMVLPPTRELSEIEDLDIAGYMLPADEVGGDYYDVLRGNGVVKIGIGDVTGHGLESGVLMLMVQTAVRTLLASNETDPTRFLGIVNKVIYQNIQRINSDKNLTLSLLDYSDGKLKLTGQHEEVIVVRKSGKLERIDTADFGIPVGVDEDITKYLSNTEIPMDSGDVAVLFTDGVTEAERTDTAQYGVERLCEVVVTNHTKPAQEIKEAIIADVMSHIGTNKVYDDITVLVIKRL